MSAKLTFWIENPQKLPKGVSIQFSLSEKKTQSLKVGTNEKGVFENFEERVLNIRVELDPSQSLGATPGLTAMVQLDELEKKQTKRLVELKDEKYFQKTPHTFLLNFIPENFGVPLTLFELARQTVKVISQYNNNKSPLNNQVIAIHETKVGEDHRAYRGISEAILNELTFAFKETKEKEVTITLAVFPGRYLVQPMRLDNIDESGAGRKIRIFMFGVLKPHTSDIIEVVPLSPTKPMFKYLMGSGSVEILMHRLEFNGPTFIETKSKGIVIRSNLSNFGKIMVVLDVKAKKEDEVYIDCLTSPEYHKESMEWIESGLQGDIVNIIRSDYPLVFDPAVYQ